MKPYFLSCDWGTSSFRLRLADTITGAVISQLSAAEGIAHAYALWQQSGLDESRRIDFYLSILNKYCSQVIKAAGIDAGQTPVIISGMASSSIGMLELPYAPLPFAVDGSGLVVEEIKATIAFPQPVLLVAGAATGKDVMRGEETQLVGCAKDVRAGQQVFVFPGTHSKHIVVTAGKATDIETYMTGEFFALLSKQSILAGSVAAGGDMDDNDNKEAFVQAVCESKDQNLLHSSFMVRTNQLFKKYAAAANWFYLSGLLIGTELNKLLNKGTDNITIVGEKKLQDHYRIALQVLDAGIQVNTTDADTAIIKGQMVIYHRLFL